MNPQDAWIPQLQITGGKKRPVASRGAVSVHEEGVFGHRLYCSPAAARLPRWKGLRYLPVSSSLRGQCHRVAWNRAAQGCFLLYPWAEVWRNSDPKLYWKGLEWVRDLIHSLFKVTYNLSLLRGYREPYTEQKFAGIKLPQQKTHYANISLLRWHNIEHKAQTKPKQTKQKSIVELKKNHFLKSFSAPLTPIRTAIMLKWTASPENWINWDIEKTTESNERDWKNKRDNRWKVEMQCLNCSCNSASSKHV